MTIKNIFRYLGKICTMVDINEIHLGNWVQVEVEGERLTGKVERKSVERIGVNARDELAWYFPKDVFPIRLTTDWLEHFDFVEEESKDGELAYRHGPFKLTYPDKDNKQHIILSCHGAHSRDFQEGLYVHDLQNHYHGMTKVFIE